MNAALDPLPADPLLLFQRWYAAAEAHDGIQYAGAMTLSTTGPDGAPDGRIVLLHDASNAGFAFMTDARSPAGRALEREPRVALTVYWGPLERQVRLRGRAAPAPDDEADAFFACRPRRSQTTAWASVQSAPVADRAMLEQQMQEIDARFESRAALPRPPHWTAYRVRPHAAEFWAARARRLHDRVLYTRAVEDRTWTIQRLSP